MGRRKIIAGDPDEINEIQSKRHGLRSAKGRFWQIALVVVACFCVAGFSLSAFYYQRQQTELNSLRAGQSSLEYKKQELAQIVEAASKLAVLPVGSPLGVQLSSQAMINKWPLLTEAKIGDWILQYPQGVYVYRPGSRQLVATGDLMNGNQKIAAATVAIRNGGALQGAASEMADRLKTLDYLNIIEVGNAATSTYNGNILVNQTGKPADELLNLLQASSTASLPAGEASSSADYLIIIGN
ncbi:MAG: LytR C-terminal domain-containing protein [Candidatus Falkowbacteria bacterium]